MIIFIECLMEGSVRQIRSWGYSETIEDFIAYKLRKLVLKPFCSIGLQYNSSFYKHYIIISGSGLLEMKNTSIDLYKNLHVSVEEKVAYEVKNSSSFELIALEITINNQELKKEKENDFEN